jgi:hypothetical protein
MPRSSKNKKTCFSRKELRNKVNRRVRTTIKRVIRKAVQTRRKKLSKILRKLRTLRIQKGGNYTTDATVMTMGGEPIKAPNTMVVSSGGKVMSGSAYQRSLDSLSREAY